jgi:hypothetical protein
MPRIGGANNKMLDRILNTMNNITKILSSGIAFLVVSACSNNGQLDVSSGVGVNVTRSGCPAVAVPDGTGDVTLFNPEGNQSAAAIDVVGVITKLRPVCNDTGTKIYTETSFEVLATRMNASGARTVTMPYFSTIVQGGSAVVSKRIGQITLQFADGQTKAMATGKAASYIDASAARLPEDIITKITKKRKAGDTDAALDPLADPDVKAAILRSSFEQLIGFQLTEDQLRYNVTR